jgi:hypothetical protein
LDINTPKGQESKAQEQRLLRSLRKQYISKGIDIQFAETNKTLPVPMDGVMIIDGEVTGVYEVKCRNMNLDKLKNSYGNETLLTYDKLCAGVAVSEKLMVPFYCIVFLVDEPLGLLIQLTDLKGQIIAKTKIERTKTPASVNGGSAVRTNAYIDMSTAHPFPILD